MDNENEGEGGEVIELNFRKVADDLAVPFTVIGGANKCEHDVSFVVDVDKRIVECGKCKEPVNAFDVLTWYADNWKRLRQDFLDARRDIAIAKGEVERALRDRANVRRSKDGRCEVVEVDARQYSDRPDAGVRLGASVLHHVRNNRAVLFVPKGGGS